MKTNPSKVFVYREGSPVQGQLNQYKIKVYDFIDFHAIAEVSPLPPSETTPLCLRTIPIENLKSKGRLFIRNLSLPYPGLKTTGRPDQGLSIK